MLRVPSAEAVSVTQAVQRQVGLAYVHVTLLLHIDAGGQGQQLGGLVHTYRKPLGLSKQGIMVQLLWLRTLKSHRQGVREQAEVDPWS